MNQEEIKRRLLDAYRDRDEKATAGALADLEAAEADEFNKRLDWLTAQCVAYIGDDCAEICKLIMARKKG